jgi:ATP-binding cassette subfamily F protein uup
MSAPLLALRNIALTFGGTPLLEEAELQVSEGDRLAIVGRNGSGKSTLMRIAAGFVEPDHGTRFVDPSATLRYLPQEVDFGGHASVRAYVEDGLGPGDDPYRARLLLEALGLSGDERPGTLSGGEARRAGLARVLAPDPDILLLDEPTNHLDIQLIEWLEQRLRERRGALVLVSHDRRLLGNLARGTVWLDRGKTRRVEFGFSAFEAWRDDALAQEALERHKLARKIEREADWLRYGVTARRKRNVRRYGALRALREKLRKERSGAGLVRVEPVEGSLSGKLVIEANGVSKAFGSQPVVDNFTLRVKRGDRVGIVGANGAGKTTLVKLITGSLSPDSGSVRLGANLECASLEQSRESLKPDWTLTDALTGGADLITVNGQAKHVSAYARDFLFAPEQLRTPVKVLSGGERGRLMLARALAKPSNLLVLDEPTNDLDLETLDVLEEILGDYAGTIILVSHDRDFLDRVVTSVIASEGGGRWVEYAGGYTDMLAQGGLDHAPKTPRPAEKAQQPLAPILPGRAAAKPKRRLGFNEKRALETLPGRIAEMAQEVRELENRLADPGLYARDKLAYERTNAALAKVQAELAAAEERWLELEMLREELAQ